MVIHSVRVRLSYRIGAAQSQRTIRIVCPNAISVGIERRKSGYSLGVGAISIAFEVLKIRKPFVSLVNAISAGIERRKSGIP